MKVSALVVLFATMVVSGCDTISGVTRTATIRSLPDLKKVKARLETYPEIKDVRFEERVGSRPLTLSGIKPPDEVFYLHYSGHEGVRGSLWFERNFKGEVKYHQSLLSINRRPPQSTIDATWPVMKKIESDLENLFGLSEIRDTLKIGIARVEDPERKAPNKAPEPTPGAVTPRATEGASK